MEIAGRVENGVVVLEGAPALPEGAKVTVSYQAPMEAGPESQKRRIEVPLVRTGQPGTVNLTAQKIAEVFDEEDVSSPSRRTCKSLPLTKALPSTPD